LKSTFLFDALKKLTMLALVKMATITLAPHPGAVVVILKIISPKILTKILAFLLKLLLPFAKILSQHWFLR
jgi:hypothetical protein